MPRTSPTVSFPSRRDTAEARGVALQYWIQENRDPATGLPWTQMQLALSSGIGRPQLQRYLTGAYDLANSTQELVERLVGTMGMSDADARVFFGIPRESLVRWRTFRPPPLGHGMERARPASERFIALSEPLKGEVACSGNMGLGMTIDTAVTTGLVVPRTTSGLYVVPRGPSPVPGAEVMGGFRGVGFAPEHVAAG